MSQQVQRLLVIFSLLSFFIYEIQAASKYEFNVCRINNCNSRETACIQDEGTCLKGFSDTRQCFDTCNSGEDVDNWNGCWARCKNEIYATNALYQEVVACYEDICYVSEQRLRVLFGTIATMGLLIAMMMS